MKKSLNKKQMENFVDTSNYERKRLWKGEKDSVSKKRPNTMIL